MDGRSFLKYLEVILFVTGVLVQDEEIRAQKADHEPQIELTDHVHLSKVLLWSRKPEGPEDVHMHRAFPVGQQRKSRACKKTTLTVQ